MGNKPQKIIQGTAQRPELLGSIDAKIVPRREDNEMSTLQKESSHKDGKNNPKRTQTAAILSLVSAILISGLILIPVAVEAKFKIEVQICCVSSDSGNAKIKVNLPDGTSTSKKVNLAKLAESQDWDNVAVFIKLKHRYESFRVCVSGHGCQWGEAGDAVQFKGFN